MTFMRNPWETPGRIPKGKNFEEIIEDIYPEIPKDNQEKSLNVFPQESLKKHVKESRHRWRIL